MLSFGGLSAHLHPDKCRSHFAILQESSITKSNMGNIYSYFIYILNKHNKFNKWNEIYIAIRDTKVSSLQYQYILDGIKQINLSGLLNWSITTKCLIFRYDAVDEFDLYMYLAYTLRRMLVSTLRPAFVETLQKFCVSHFPQKVC